MIRAREVNVIGPNGEPLGVFSTNQALAMAADHELDLVEVSPNSNPPVCRIMDYGKFKYKQNKRAHEAKKNQKVIHVKEIKFRPNTDQHDFDFKIKHVQRFIESGDKAKIVIFFKGREIIHREHGMKILERILHAVENYASVEQPPRQEGRMIVMILGPKTGSKKKASATPLTVAVAAPESDVAEAGIEEDLEEDVE